MLAPIAELLYSGVNGKPLFSTVAGMIVSMALAEVSLLSAISIELPMMGSDRKGGAILTANSSQ